MSKSTKKATKSEKAIVIPQLKVDEARKQLLELQADTDLEILRSFNDSEISIRLEMIQIEYDTFDNFQSIIEEQNPEEIKRSTRSDFKRLYMSVKSAFSEELRIRKNKEQVSTTKLDNSFQPVLNSSQKTRLPAINLPTFSGKYTDWADFYASFRSTIGNQDDLSEIEKFQYLRSCLKGSALDIITSLEINAENYIKALEILTERFDNKRLNFQAHIKELFNLKSVHSDWSLQQLSDSSKSHLRALESMATKAQIADGLLIHLLGKKMDLASQANWEEITPIDELPEWNAMEKFLDRRCKTLETVGIAMNDSLPKKQVSKFVEKPNTRKSAYISSASQANCCIICNSKDHIIYRCSIFLSLTPSDRVKEVKRLKICFNCLKPGHGVKDCKSSNCRTCSSKHHTLLHIVSTSNASDSSFYNTTSSRNVSSQPTVNINSFRAPSPGHSNIGASTEAHLDAAHSSPSTQPFRLALVSSSTNASSTVPEYNSSSYVILGTAIIFVKNRCGTLVPCRAILDSASQLNFVTNRFVDQLGLRKKKSTTVISGIGESDFISDAEVDLCLKSQNGTFNTTISAVIHHRITDHQPNFILNTADWNIPKNVQLADPFFNQPQPIDILLGAGIFYDLMCIGQIRIGKSLPLLQKTKLGWIVCGSGQHIGHNATCLSSIRKSKMIHDADHELENMVKKFWEIEDGFQEPKLLTKEDVLCEKHFVQHHTRLADGSYSVHLPFKTDPLQLGNSFDSALRRFKSLEKRLDSNMQLKLQYSSFMKEYLNLEHMHLVKEIPSDTPTYFIPHHCVHKLDSTTTKLRVVFDGSASTNNGLSLNDILMAGPTIQMKLCEILLRFRTFKIAITADICKMYRCVKVSYPDDFVQCILWREHVNDFIQIYKLNTVTYGTKSAAFLAVRAMHQLAIDECANFPIGSNIVRRDFYVDDMISGANSFEEANQVVSQTKELLNKGKFLLRKWCSSSTEVLSKIPVADRDEFLVFHDGTNVTKTLGLVWDPAEDVFLFTFVSLPKAQKLNKRSILSAIARFYDPLGLIGPIITKAKIFHQQLWKMKLDWDESLPQSLQTEWLEFYSQFDLVHTIKFRRLVIIPGSNIEIHGFCDASIEAYGACVYVRSHTEEFTQTTLLCSKSRVAPIKTLSIPRLELLAANLLAELMSSIAKLNIFDTKYHCWSDSSIVLSWLNDEPARYNVFVANRISNIQTLTKDMIWHHVPSKLNPADVLSKGITAQGLKAHSLWFDGPSFLQKEANQWPSLPISLVEAPERRKAVCLSTSATVDYSINSKYANSFSKMQRIFAYIYRFGTKHNPNRGPLNVSDVHNGTRLLIRMIQRKAFITEYQALESQKPIHHSSPLYTLMPFIDSFGLIRVGGRLQKSLLDFEGQHPIIIPKSHPISKAIIMFYHCKFLHSGSQALLASMRLKYWPIGGRKYVSSVIKTCIRCFRVKPRILEHVMGNLPKERVQPSRAFFNTGIDFCGPFLCSSGIRGRAATKSYICLFICFATKAIHLELVRDLTTQSFLAALQRFICTRGRPKAIWSDNATNFVGAKNKLKELREFYLNQANIRAIEHQCLDEGIEWKFIPPRSPHFGGLWEAAIKTAKYHFYRVVGNYSFQFEELRTLICQIAAIVNSRPLCPITEDPDDLAVLTPAHFLIGSSFTSFIEPDLQDTHISRLSRWQRICYIQQVFWRKWSHEYLTTLQQRSKWNSSTQNVKLGSMVLLKDENLPPLKWEIGRVINVSAGDDGIIRVATVRTKSGIMKRAVRKLCELPIEDLES